MAFFSKPNYTIDAQEFLNFIKNLDTDFNTITNYFPIGFNTNTNEAGNKSLVFIIQYFKKDVIFHLSNFDTFISKIFSDEQIAIILNYDECRRNIFFLYNHANEFKNNSFELERTRNEILKLLPECLEMNKKVREIILSILLSL